MKKIKLLDMKNEKSYMGFLIIKKIANFEAFWQDKNFSKHLLFLGSGHSYVSKYLLIYSLIMDSS